jgi:hypothetical protein
MGGHGRGDPQSLGAIGARGREGTELAGKAPEMFGRVIAMQPKPETVLLMDTFVRSLAGPQKGASAQYAAYALGFVAGNSLAAEIRRPSCSSKKLKTRRQGHVSDAWRVCRVRALDHSRTCPRAGLRRAVDEGRQLGRPKHLRSKSESRPNCRPARACWQLRRMSASAAAQCSV